MHKLLKVDLTGHQVSTCFVSNGFCFAIDSQTLPRIVQETMKNLQGLHLSDSSASSSPVQMPGKSANSKGSLCLVLNFLVPNSTDPCQLSQMWRVPHLIRNFLQCILIGLFLLFSVVHKGIVCAGCSHAIAGIRYKCW